jgi:hypothetical protein
MIWPVICVNVKPRTYISLTTHLRGDDMKFYELKLTETNEVLILYFLIVEVSYLTVLEI